MDRKNPVLNTTWCPSESSVPWASRPYVACSSGSGIRCHTTGALGGHAHGAPWPAVWDMGRLSQVLSVLSLVPCKPLPYLLQNGKEKSEYEL